VSEVFRHQQRPQLMPDTTKLAGRCKPVFLWHERWNVHGQTPNSA